MQCREVRELADSFVTDQLLVETNHEVVRHLETCPACYAEVAARGALREKLRSAFANAETLRPRPEFAAELAAKLQRSQGLSRRSLLRSWWALAAGVVAAAGSGAIVRDARSRSRLATLAREAAGDHLNCAVHFKLAERPIDLAEAGRRFGAPYSALATMEFSGINPRLQTIERHACVFQGRRFAHIVFRYDGALASLLITEGQPPASPALETQDDGPAVASLPAGAFTGFVVADLDGPRLLRLAHALSDPLARSLA